MSPVFLFHPCSSPRGWLLLEGNCRTSGPSEKPLTGSQEMGVLLLLPLLTRCLACAKPQALSGPRQDDLSPLFS